MADRELVEAQIRELLVTETSAVALSNKLFTPNGLFNQIAKTEDERRAMVSTPLFRQAQQRLRELEKRDLAELDRLFEQVKGHLPQSDFEVRLVRAERR